MMIIVDSARLGLLLLRGTQDLVQGGVDNPSYARVRDLQNR